MDLSTIKNTGNWGSSAANLNENFSKVGLEVDKLKYAAYNSKLYATEALLKQAVPSPKVGDWAIVGDSIPGEIYQCRTDGVWTATGQTGGGYGMEVTNITEVGDVTNMPDDEDLISEEKPEGLSVLKFADKAYNASAFSGMGRAYLRKNMVASKNVLTQAMVGSANTRYIIQYDYDLNGETITVPEGSMLDFQGGSISNGTINGNCTVVHSDSRIFGPDVTLTGSWSGNALSVRWFGAVGDGVTDDTQAFQAAFACMMPVVIPYSSNAYLLTGTISVYEDVECRGKVMYKGSSSAFVVLNKTSPSGDFPKILNISGLEVFSDNRSGSIGIWVKRPATFLSKCVAYNLYTGIRVTAFTVKLISCSARACNKNLSIGGTDQTYLSNDVLVDGGNYDSPKSSTSIHIGDPDIPSSIPANEYHGTSIQISNLACDGGSIRIDRFQSVRIHNVYSENAALGAVIVNALGAQYSQVEVDSCYLANTPYGIRVYAPSYSRLSFTNNTIYFGITKCAIYVEDSTYNKCIYVWNNNTSFPAFSGLRQIHIGGSQYAASSYKFPSTLTCDTLNIVNGVHKGYIDGEWLCPNSIIEDDTSSYHFNVIHNCWNGTYYKTKSSIQLKYEGISGSASFRKFSFTDTGAVKKFSPYDVISSSAGSYCIVKIDYDNNFIYTTAPFWESGITAGTQYVFSQSEYKTKRIAFASSDQLLWGDARKGDIVLREELAKGGTCIGEYYTGSGWKGLYPFILAGDSASRPSLDGTIEGVHYFDSTLNKPIWWNGSKWVDSSGNAV